MLIGITGEEKGRIIFAKALAQSLNRPLCLVDFNHKNRHLEIAFEVENEVVYDVLDYLKGDCSLYQSTLEIDEGIDLIPSSFLADKYEVSKEDTQAFKEELEEEYETIIFIEESGIRIKDSLDQWILIDSEEETSVYSGELFEIGKKDRGKGLYLGEMKGKDKIFKNIKKLSLEKEEELALLVERFKNKEKAKQSFFKRLFGR